MAGADAPGPHSERMPLYPYFLALVFSLSGGTNLGAAVSFQAIVDSLTVLAVAYLVAAIDRRWALPAGILAALWPKALPRTVMHASPTAFYLGVWLLSILGGLAVHQVAEWEILRVTPMHYLFVSLVVVAWCYPALTGSRAPLEASPGERSGA